MQSEQAPDAVARSICKAMRPQTLDTPPYQGRHSLGTIRPLPCPELADMAIHHSQSVRYATRADSAFSAALDPDRTTELTITATDWTYRPANKYASAQRPLFGRSVRSLLGCVCGGMTARPDAVDWPRQRQDDLEGWPGRDRGVCQCPLVAAWYCSTTLAGMRPRALTVMSWSFAHARISPLRSRLAVRPGRRRCPRLALRA